MNVSAQHAAMDHTMNKRAAPKLVASTCAALALSGVVAAGADMPAKVTPAVPAPSPWDFAFGADLASDSVSRGITQSNHRPSITAYFEPRYIVSNNLQLYAGISGESIDSPNRAAAEIDFYSGVRPTFDKLALDFGFWYYEYPGGINYNGRGPSLPPVPPAALGANATCANGVMAMPVAALGPGCQTAKGNGNFWEVYAKPTVALNDYVAAGANFFYSPSWTNSGAYGAYASGILRITAPTSWLADGYGAYLSGEFGHYRFGTTDSFYGTMLFPAGIKYPDYNTWNVGIGFTKSALTFDLRYSQTDLSKSNCAVLTSDHTAALGGVAAASAANPGGFISNWCGAAFIAKLSADLTSASLK